MIRSLPILTALLATPFASAHHSSFGIFDEENLVAIEGIVTSLRWRNPHPTFTVEVAGEDGRTVEWHVETGSVSTLRLKGVTRDFFEVGKRVTIAGQSSLRGLPEMFAQNLLLDDGREVLLRAVSQPYWPAGLAGNVYEREVDEARAVEGRRRAEGIYRTWSPVVTDPEAYPLYGGNDYYPLTEQGRARMDAWDPRSSPFIGCHPKGMPYIMGTAYPIEFVAQGEDLLIRAEEFDTERVIHMNERLPENPEDYSLLGYSTGRWDGERLIVETHGIEETLLYGNGTPQSREIRLTEYFEMNETEDRLDYRLVISDPAMFSETLEFTRFWVWQPDIVIEPYDCQA